MSMITVDIIVFYFLSRSITINMNESKNQTETWKTAKRTFRYSKKLNWNSAACKAIYIAITKEQTEDNQHFGCGESDDYQKFPRRQETQRAVFGTLRIHFIFR